MIRMQRGRQPRRLPRGRRPDRALRSLVRHGLGLTAALASGATALAGQVGSFGSSILVHGNQVIIAEPNPTFRPGAAYVYEETTGGRHEPYVLHAPGFERADGFATALARVGNLLVVGQRSGPLHVFERGDGGEWTPAGRIEDDGVRGIEPRCNDFGYCNADFGLTLAGRDGWLFAGAPAWSPGTGRPRASAQGVVHIYRRDENGHWVHRAKLQGSAGAEGDRFGAAIAFTPHGVLVGAPGADEWALAARGHVARRQEERQRRRRGDPRLRRRNDIGLVYEFRLGADGWREVAVLESVAEANGRFGSAIAAADRAVFVGAPGADSNRGAVYAYSWDETQSRWVPEGGRLAVPDGEDGDLFGAALAFAGSDVWVGAPAERGYENGAVYVYEADDDGNLATMPRRLQLPNAETVQGDRYGALIAAQDDVVAVGAPGLNHRFGAVHVWRRGSEGSWGDAGLLISAPDAIGSLLGEERRCSGGKVGPFDCEEVDLLSFLPNSMLKADGRAYGVHTNDIWGWTDPLDGREYALVGRVDGTSFVDVTDPSNPVLVGDLPKPPGTPPSQLWRDIKTYRNYAYIVADGTADYGMQIFDLTRLRDVPEVARPALFEPDAHYLEFAGSHNIVINEETGYAYAVGNSGPRENCGGGLHMIDLSDPRNPEFVGCGPTRRIHDSQCVAYRGPDERYRGRELCLNSSGDAFEISDVTDKTNPVSVASASSPRAAYIHQGWLTPDHRYFYQNDELDVLDGSAETTRTLIWDVADVEDPILVNQFMGSFPASAHNHYPKDGLLYQANYRHGLQVLDVSDPVHPQEVGFFDTAPYQEGPGLSGAWGVYPFFESGTVIVTSMQEGLFVLRKREGPGVAAGSVRRPD